MGGVSVAASIQLSSLPATAGRLNFYEGSAA